MSNTVYCQFYKQEMPALENAPYPGELGQRIVKNISEAAWKQWLERSVMIINEYQLNSANPEHIALIEKHMVGFLFNEGEYGLAPEGFNQA